MSAHLPGQLGLDGWEAPPAAAEPLGLFSELEIPPPAAPAQWFGQCSRLVRRPEGKGPCLRFLRADGLCDRPSKHVG